ATQRRPRRRPRDVERDDRPCRACAHYDCRMDRGEALPPHVRAYRDGVRYHDAPTRARAREEAIRVVDGRHGYSIEFAADPAAHDQEWRAEEERLLATWDTAEQARYLQPTTEDHDPHEDRRRTSSAPDLKR